MRAPRIAVVGAGPAGAYAAGMLLAGRHRPWVDLFDRLPTPWGLLRGGVAPDHQEIKALAAHFEATVVRPRCRFLGNVEVGDTVSHDELAERYSAVVYAVGARTDKRLGVPGEDLRGSLAATDLVGWYNGHPDRRELEVPLEAERVVVIGNGNVAADVARILVKPTAELARTDIADHALAALRSSRVREVVILGRRGPAQVAFTNAELRELGHVDGADIVVSPEEVEPDPLSREWLARDASFTARQNLELLHGFANRPAGSADRRIVLRFLRSPVAIRGTSRVETIEIEPNELESGAHGQLRPRPVADGQRETLECGLVLRCVGYQAVPLPGVPFDERRFVLPNERGRVAPGVYAVGWIKRGPTGILGTNKRDAEETVAALHADLARGRLRQFAGPAELDALVSGAVSFEGWAAIDAHERAAGAAQRRPRVKLANHAELQRVADMDRTSVQAV